MIVEIKVQVRRGRGTKTLSFVINLSVCVAGDLQKRGHRSCDKSVTRLRDRSPRDREREGLANRIRARNTTDVYKSAEFFQGTLQELLVCSRHNDWCRINLYRTAYLLPFCGEK